MCLFVKEIRIKWILEQLLHCSKSPLAPSFNKSLKPIFYSVAIPSAEPKAPPESLFFKVSEQANAIFHLFEKHFTDCVIGLVA